MKQNLTFNFYKSIQWSLASSRGKKPDHSLSNLRVNPWTNEQGDDFVSLHLYANERTFSVKICPYRTNPFKTVQSTENLYLWIGVVFMGNLSVKGKFQGVSTLEPTRGWLLPRGWIIQAAQWPLDLRIPLQKTYRAKNISCIQFFKKAFRNFIIFFRISSPFNRTRAFYRFCENHDLSTDN